MVVGALKHDGHAVSRKRIVRLMREENLAPRLKRRYVSTTKSDHDRRVAPNVLKRNFEVGQPNKVWASDITYLHTNRGWVYLAVVIDFGVRKPIGWAVSDSMEDDLVVTALEAALKNRKPEIGLLHHSDRGVQYASHVYQALLAENDIDCSMSRKGNCWDNACVESFFSAMKRELPNDTPFEDWREVELAVFAYIEGYYNTKRRHSTLGYLTPNEYEEMRAAA